MKSGYGSASVSLALIEIQAYEPLHRKQQPAYRSCYSTGGYTARMTPISVAVPDGEDTMGNGKDTQQCGSADLNGA